MLVYHISIIKANLGINMFHLTKRVSLRYFFGLYLTRKYFLSVCHNPFLGYSPICIFSLKKQQNTKKYYKTYKSEKRVSERLENDQNLVKEVQKYKD